MILDDQTFYRNKEVISKVDMIALEERITVKDVFKKIQEVDISFQLRSFIKNEIYVVVDKGEIDMTSIHIHTS